MCIVLLFEKIIDLFYIFQTYFTLLNKYEIKIYFYLNYFLIKKVYEHFFLIGLLAYCL